MPPRLARFEASESGASCSSPPCGDLTPAGPRNALRRATTAVIEQIDRAAAIADAWNQVARVRFEHHPIAIGAQARKPTGAFQRIAVGRRQRQRVALQLAQKQAAVAHAQVETGIARHVGQP
ncbi:hypothetical protein CATMIT_01597 [Catenibacterium mitsuokai DSM 15897]|nr:hypothetical protein CATMIT_01597 [Catenibacterium mitsuokai DSM 15897]